MSFDVLILDSGAWTLTRELDGAPWRILVYSQRGAPRNELHAWAPVGAPASSAVVFRRYWEFHSTRWTLEISSRNAASAPGSPPRNGIRIRFRAPDDRTFVARAPRGRSLGDLSDAELLRMLAARTATLAPANAL